MFSMQHKALAIGMITVILAIGNIPTFAESPIILADDKLITAKARWVTEKDEINEVIKPLFLDYGYAIKFKPFSFNEIKDITISGVAVEESSPQKTFNFFILDEVNFELWQEDIDYDPYYEIKNVKTANFTISFPNADTFPDSIYFVVESVDEEPVVQLTATIEWIEEAFAYQYSDYSLDTTPLFADVSFNKPTLKGNATEINGNEFNFYILDFDNYSNWSEDKPYKAYYEAKNVTSTSFSIPLPEEFTFLYFVVENTLIDKDVTVRLTAIVEDSEPTPELTEFNIPISKIEENIKIKGSITTGNINSITIDKELNSLIITLSDITTDGQLIVTLPPTIVKEEFRKEFSDIDFSVYSSIAGELDFVKEFDGENWILTIDIPEGLKNLRITILPDNIQVVPEFGIIAVLIFAVSIGTLIMLNKKRI